MTDHDLKKIKLMKLREAVKKVDRKGFKSESSSDDEEMQEEGEQEMSEDDLKEGESVDSQES